MNFQEFVQRRPDLHRRRAGSGMGHLHQQDPYLSKHRGEYAERNAVFLPVVPDRPEHLAGPVQEPRRQAQRLQVRLDILNFGNLLNSDWGVSQRYATGSATATQPLLVPTAAQGGARQRPGASRSTGSA